MLVIDLPLRLRVNVILLDPPYHSCFHLNNFKKTLRFKDFIKQISFSLCSENHSSPFYHHTYGQSQISSCCQNQFRRTQYGFLGPSATFSSYFVYFYTMTM